LELHDAMCSPRYFSLVRAIDVASLEPQLRPGCRHKQRATRFARRSTRRAWRRTATFARQLTPEAADADLHELRKRAKRARYTAELTAPLHRRSLERLARRLTLLQDSLGALQDATVADTWLRGLPLEALAPGQAFAVGSLLRVNGEDGRRHRERWPIPWRRVEEAARAARLGDAGR
jgi:CHAD domain-containing protein